MEFTYQNCKVNISDDDGITFSIMFGETFLYHDLEALSIQDAQFKSKKLIDNFISHLPSALSYKY